MSDIIITKENFKRFAKRLQKEASFNLSLSESQELFARALGAQNLNELQQLFDKNLTINMGTLNREETPILCDHVYFSRSVILHGNKDKRCIYENHIIKQHKHKRVYLFDNSSDRELELKLKDVDMDIVVFDPDAKPNHKQKYNTYNSLNFFYNLNRSNDPAISCIEFLNPLIHDIVYECEGGHLITINLMNHLNEIFLKHKHFMRGVYGVISAIKENTESMTTIEAFFSEYRELYQAESFRSLLIKRLESLKGFPIDESRCLPNLECKRKELIVIRNKKDDKMFDYFIINSLCKDLSQQVIKVGEKREILKELEETLIIIDEKQLPPGGLLIQYYAAKLRIGMLWSYNDRESLILKGYSQPEVLDSCITITDTNTKTDNNAKNIKIDKHEFKIIDSKFENPYYESYNR